MTYCVAIKLNAGLVFLSDSRTNAGLDQISTFRKMIVYERPGDRFMVLLSAGNLSISQSVREMLQVEQLKNALRFAMCMRVMASRSKKRAWNLMSR
jgi:putative proteasome-type protease